MPGRIGKRCRERYENHLNPNLRKEAWSKEEEAILLSAHEQLGNKVGLPTSLHSAHALYLIFSSRWYQWTEIGKRLKGRSANDIKNQWYSIARRSRPGGGKKRRLTHSQAGSQSNLQPPLPSSNHEELLPMSKSSAPRIPLPSRTVFVAAPSSNSTSLQGIGTFLHRHPLPRHLAFVLPSD